MTKFKVRFSQNIASFAQISSKQALKYVIFLNIKKGYKGQIILCLANHLENGQMATMTYT